MNRVSAAAAFTAAKTCAGAIWDATPPLQDVLARSQAAQRAKKETEAEAEEAANGVARTRDAIERRRDEAKSLLASKSDIERTLERLGVSQGMLDEWALRGASEETKQIKAPWYDESIWALRHKVFGAALDLHKSFLAANRDTVLDNLASMIAVLTGGLWRNLVASRDLQTLWNTLFLAVPVVSTTFASLGRVFEGLSQESLGWLIIDEAGQAPPQVAVGGIWRARRTVVVGDPLQIEPVVTIPEKAIDMLRERCGVGAEWHPIRCSAQVLADRANRLGTELNGKWVGAPLRVHHRCREPMFGVANAIAYDNMMVYGTAEENTPWLGESCWIDVPARDANGHWIPAQGDMAARIVCNIAKTTGLYNSDGEANVYVISPFKKVGEEMRKLLIKRPEIRAALGASSGGGEEKLRSIAGTVHTFQGKAAPVVVLLLGGDPANSGSITGYAAKTPNILNVALTRAKTRVYIVGDYPHWSKAPYFRTLAKELRRLGTTPVNAKAFARQAGLGPSLLKNSVKRFSAGWIEVPLEVVQPSISSESLSVPKETTESIREYEVALSFAGEDRPYVDDVASSLQRAGVRIFYDRDKVGELWGKDLYEYLRYVYAEASEYVVMFISKAYARSLWATHERKSAQARAFDASKDYILPARFDDTEIPGLLKTTGFVDLRHKAPEELASLIREKLAGRTFSITWQPTSPSGNGAHQVLASSAAAGDETAAFRG